VAVGAAAAAAVVPAAARPGVAAAEHRRGAADAEGAVRAVRKRGLSLDGHRAQPLTRELVNRADAIYTMTAAHREAVLDLAPDAAGKTYRLDADRDVTDPIGADDAVYESTAEMIHAAITRRFKEHGIDS